MSEFPNTLKSWRKARRFSQLRLAMEAEVSSRHISFLETGRAHPSADMISRLSDALQLPLSARNQMLTHAGFAVRYPTRKWSDAEMSPVRMALEHMLANHTPYPAIALDRFWNIVKGNDPARVLFSQFGVEEGDNLLDTMAAPDTPQKIENWPEVAHHVAQRLRLESSAMGGVQRFDEVANQLMQVPKPRSETLLPIVATVFRSGDMRLSLFATIAQFGTPEDLLLDDLKIELYFPADEASRKLVLAMAQ